MIIFESVSKIYPSGHSAIEDVSFSIDPGEFVFLIGPSGSGKTTLLRLIIREVKPTTGRILVASQDLDKIPNSKIPLLRRQIGSAFQDFKLLPDKSAFENVAVVLDIIGKKSKQVLEQASSLLEKVGLADKMHLYPAQLSGGEIQRVAIARAMASDPVLLFADEPTGNLDPDTSIQITNLLQEINQSGTTVIMATHDINLASQFDYRQIQMQFGKLINDTKPKPADEETRDQALVSNTLEDDRENEEPDELEDATNKDTRKPKAPVPPKKKTKSKVSKDK